MSSTPKGMRDVMPEDMLVRESVKERITELYRGYGYRPLDTPALEYLDTLRKKAGEEADKQIFVLKDERLGLRFDLTVPLARVAAGSDFPRPFKRYCIAPVWRKEEPQKGRFREFWQADVDIIGSPSMRCEAELLTLAKEACAMFGFESPKILLNNRKILEALAVELGMGNEKEEVFRILDKIDKIGRAAVEEQLELILGEKASDFLSYIKTTGKNGEKLERVRDVCTEGVGELERILELCDFEIEVDLSLVRGLGYYTGPVFEIKLSKDIGTVMAGGRYDGLLQVYGQPDPAVGISIGIERLITLIADREKQRKLSRTEIFVACAKPEFYGDALATASKLRKKGALAETDLKDRNLRKQFDYVNALGIPFMVIIGRREKDAKKITLRDMVSGKEEMVSLAEALKRIREG
ncbi:MAG: histidine--tRNA ligase [Candidatus Micrarchaeota archaeon]